MFSSPSENPAELQLQHKESRAGARIPQGDCGLLSLPLLTNRGVFTKCLVTSKPFPASGVPVASLSPEFGQTGCFALPHRLLVQEAECEPKTRAVPATFSGPCPWVCAVPLDRETCHAETGDFFTPVPGPCSGWLS